MWSGARVAVAIGAALIATSACGGNGETVADRQAFTKGTWISLRNDTGSTFYYRKYFPMDGWGSVSSLFPGETVDIRANEAGFDDIELHIFADSAKADGNEMNGGIDVQAENPAWSAPWVSYHGWEEWFQDEGETHSYVERCNKRELGQKNEAWIKREGDSATYKRFSVHIKKLVILPDGAHHRCGGSSGGGGPA